MDTYLLALGYWNLFGSFLMMCFLYQPFGQYILNSTTKIFNKKFIATYWIKLWLFWAAGLNIFFGLINIMSVTWAYPELKLFLIYSDLIAYIIFLALAFWGFFTKNLGTGAFSVFIMFIFWITWGIYVLI